MALNIVPNPGQTLYSSRDLINQNFSVINTAFSVNHVPYNDGSGNQGFHQFINMTSGTPSATTNNGTAQIGLYANVGAFSTIPELFFQRNNQAANTGYSITEAGNLGNGWTRLPSGIVLKWGQASGANFEGGSNGAKGNVTYPPTMGIPVFNNVFQIMLSQQWGGGDNTIGSNGFAVRSSTTAGFKVDWTGNNSTGTILTYLAIGN